MTLDEQLRTLCEEHDLNALSLTIYRRDDGTFHFGSNAHTADLCRSNGADEGLSNGFAVALRSAIERLNEARVRPVAVSELEAA